MTLTPEQTEAVTKWAAAGDNLSAIQRKLTAEYKVSITYMDLRFLLDDLNLKLKDAAPKPDSLLKGTSSPAAGPAPAAGGAGAPDDLAEGDLPEDDLPAGGGGAVRVAVDKVTLLPGAIASGTVAFPDGVTGKWIVDNQGRPGITEISQPGYRPAPADAQAFMAELSRVLQQRGY